MMKCMVCISLTVFLISIFAAQSEGRLIRNKCGQNEKYSTCGTVCPLTCSDLRYPLPKPPKACILLCISGCVCAEGYYRSDNGTCVLPEQCCGVNEKFNLCGSACVETCNDKPEECSKQCVAGCFCAGTDYVRRSNASDSVCIRRDDCTKTLDNNN